jgi:hypothetical protein
MDTLKDEIVAFFRAFALDDSALDVRQRAHRDRLAASHPAEWAAALRLGPISREEQIAQDGWNQAIARANATVAATMQ